MENFQLKINATYEDGTKQTFTLGSYPQAVKDMQMAIPVGHLLKKQVLRELTVVII